MADDARALLDSIRPGQFIDRSCAELFRVMKQRMAAGRCMRSPETTRRGLRIQREVSRAAD